MTWRTPSMRRLLAVPVLLTLLLPLAAPVAAARPATFSVDSIMFGCAPETTATGQAFAGGGVDVNPDGEFGWAQFDFFPTGTDPESGPPTVGVYQANLISADDTGAVYELILGDYVEDDFGLSIQEPNGQVAIMTVTYNASEPIPVDDRFKQGNQNIREVGLHWDLSPVVVVEGPAEIGTFTFDECSGGRDLLDVWVTQPNTFIGEFSFIDLFCGSLAGTDGSTAFLFAQDFGDGSFVDLFIEDSSAGMLAGTGEVMESSAAGMSGTVTVMNDDASVSLAGSFDASFTLVDENTVKTRSQNALHFSSQATYSVSGTLQLENGVTYDLSSCSGTSFSQRDIVHFPNGPKAKGRAPANDAPAGATPTSVGSSLQISTAATVVEPEVEASCAPLGHTVWYTLTGTGEDITIDTAGSNFDTVVAVYTSDGETFTEVACADDVPPFANLRTLQASVTFASEAGVTYYVQVGGFDHGAGDPAFGGPEFGRVRLSVQ